MITKILYVSLGENMFGTEKFISYFVNNLPVDKFEVHWGIPYESRLSNILKQNNNRYFSFENGTLSNFKIKGLINIAKYIHKNNINIVHSNSGILPCVVGKVMGVKKCYETRHGIFYSDKELNEFGILQRYHEKIKQYFVEYQIAIGENDKYRMIKHFGMIDEKIKVIPYGIDINDIRKQGIKSGLNVKSKNGKFKYLNIGRFSLQKSQLDLLKAVRMLIDEYQNFELTIIGEGEEKDNLLNYIKSNNLEKYVILKSYIDNIHLEILKYDALVMTSKYEGVPYVVSDSMALGLPVVHTDVGCVSNVIRNNVDGLLVNVENIVEIKDAMKKIATNTKLYENIQISAFNRIESYPIGKMIDEYAKVYLL
ncbi:MAG: glycosyltransferase [Ignavibacteria bacterium]